MHAFCRHTPSYSDYAVLYVICAGLQSPWYVKLCMQLVRGGNQDYLKCAVKTGGVLLWAPWDLPQVEAERESAGPLTASTLVVN